jgi:hypothetical protein
VKDLRDKLVGYFHVPSIVHYLIVDPDDRFVIHGPLSPGLNGQRTHFRRRERTPTGRYWANGFFHPPGCFRSGNALSR